MDASSIERFSFTTEPARGILLSCHQQRESDGRRVTVGASIAGNPWSSPPKITSFPSSWYPNTTPKGLERWTAPSCGRCNGEFGRLEKDLLVFFACCMDPTKPATKGLYQRVRRTMGIGVSGLSDEEMLHRAAKRRKLLIKLPPPIRRICCHTLFPGLAPHPEAPVSLQRQLTIEVESIHAVIRKIVRGCEYWLAGGRIVEPPYGITIVFPTETSGICEQSDGCVCPEPCSSGARSANQERRGARRSLLCTVPAFDFEGAVTVYATILPPEPEQTSRVMAHEEIALHAYYHWEQRGRPFGSPEVDWYWAIEDLRGAPIAHRRPTARDCCCGAAQFLNFMACDFRCSSLRSLS